MSRRDPSAEPATESMPALVPDVFDGATTAGAPATLELHHLESMRSLLAPLREAYVAAAAERLEALPREARRALMPHVLREHPCLEREPRIRALVGELLLVADEDSAPDLVAWLAHLAGVRAHDPVDALDRVEGALVGMATALTELVRWRRDHLHALAAQAKAPAMEEAELPTDTAEMLAWALDPGSITDRAVELSRGAAALILHTVALTNAARDAADAVVAQEDPARIEAEANLPKWWPSPFREAALWARLRRRQLEALPGERTARYDAALARAYFARLGRGA